MLIFIYGQEKEAIVKYHPEQDMEAYYAIKDPVCDIIHAGAEGCCLCELAGWT